MPIKPTTVGSTATEPSLSVTGRANKGGYTVTAGARSLAISNPDSATLLTTVTDQDNASITVTDGTSTAPSWTAPGGGTTGADYCVTVTATKDGLTSQVSFSELVDGSGGGAASWTTIHTVDFTTDITDLTLTKGAGDTTLYEADGTTVKATIGYADRTPTTVSSAVITAAAGKFLLTSDSGGAVTNSAFVYTELTESGTGVDWSDRSKTYAVDIVASSLDWGSNGDVVFVGLGTSASGINSGSWFGVRLDRDGGTDFKDAGRRYLGSGENGANQNASASAITTRAIRIIVSGGVIADVYWQAGTTPLEGFPTPSGSVFQSFEGGRAISMEASPETTLGATFYVIAEALSTSGSDVVVGIEQIRIQEFG